MVIANFSCMVMIWQFCIRAQTISLNLGSELVSCSKGLIDNKLSLHLGKTECILFGSRRKLLSVKYFSVECNGHTIKSQSSVKYLGLTLDNHLTSDTFASSVIQKVNSRLKYLYKQCSFLSHKIIRMKCQILFSMKN